MLIASREVNGCPPTQNPTEPNTVVHRYDNNADHEQQRWYTVLPMTTFDKRFRSAADRFVGVDLSGDVFVERWYAEGLQGDTVSQFQLVKLAAENGAQSVVASWRGLTA